MMRPRAIAPFVIVLMALAFAGCDGGDDRGAENGIATDHDLLARASAALHAEPGDVDHLSYVDLAAAREQLGLPADAGIRPGPGKRRLLFGFAARPVFRYGMLVRRRASLGPLGVILDGGKIEAAAGTNPAIATPGADVVYRGDVIVLRTRQPFDEIARLLKREAGYEERRGGLLLGGEPIDPQGPGVPGNVDRLAFPAVGDAGGGVVVFGGSARAVRAALGGADAELTPAAELVAELPGVSRVAQRGLEHSCVLAIGLDE